MTTLLPAQGAPAPPSVCAGELPGVPLHPRPPRLRLHPHRPRRHPARARPPPPPPRAPCPRLPNVRPVGCRARINSTPLLCHLPPFRSTRSARPESLHSSPHIYTAPVYTSTPPRPLHSIYARLSAPPPLLIPPFPPVSRPGSALASEFSTSLPNPAPPAPLPHPRPYSTRASAPPAPTPPHAAPPSAPFPSTPAQLPPPPPGRREIALSSSSPSP